MPRTRLKEKSDKGGMYFSAPSSSLEFVSTGCTLLNCVLGGGWPLGRVSNVVGDRSTGKTLLALESQANFCLQFDKGEAFYREAESAFDESYANALGMPMERISMIDKKLNRFLTVEDFFKDLDKQLNSLNTKNRRGFYVLDSLDALSDDAEQGREFGENTYGTGKAKAMSEAFRRSVGKIEQSRTHLMIVSQVRDKIGAMFGDKTTRAGGRALDFYASHIVWLQHLGVLTKTVRGIKRAIGVKVKAKAKKNKVGLPFRDCTFEIRFGYGIDDFRASVDWLKEVKHLDAIGVKDSKFNDYVADIEESQIGAYREEVARVAEIVKQVWGEVENGFMPSRKKY